MENVSQHTQHGFATIHDRLDGWFNLTGGELNPTPMRPEYPVICGANA